jgi:N-acetyl-gamma-glutamyl-phosphate reductase
MAIAIAKSSSAAAKSERIALVGARGHVGAELIRLIEAHPRLELALIASRELAGQPVADHQSAYNGDLRYSAPDPDSPGLIDASACVLAMPNGIAANYVQAIAASDRPPVIVDLSADHRFNDGWHYGLPELTRNRHVGQRMISNPGCYATAMQLAIAPMREHIVGPVQCFGVSGYSGAGTSPSERNDVRQLCENFMPYQLTGHLHETEVSRQMQCEVEFMPHVAPHFRGLSVTANLHLSHRVTLDDVLHRYRMAYADEPLVQVSAQIPWVTHVSGTHEAHVGGFKLSADGRRLVVISVLDNLLKGAATQAIQNLNLAFGFDEFTGIPIQRLPLSD